MAQKENIYFLLISLVTILIFAGYHQYKENEKVKLRNAKWEVKRGTGGNTNNDVKIVGGVVVNKKASDNNNKRKSGGKNAKRNYSNSYGVNSKNYVKSKQDVVEEERRREWER